MRAPSPITGQSRAYVFILFLMLAAIIGLMVLVQSTTPKSGVIPRTTHTFPPTTTSTTPTTSTTWYPTTTTTETTTTTQTTTTTVPTTTTQTTTTTVPTTTQTTTTQTTMTTTTVPPTTQTTTTTVPPTTLPTCEPPVQLGQSLSGSSAAMDGSQVIICSTGGQTSVYNYNGTYWNQAGTSFGNTYCEGVDIDAGYAAVANDYNVTIFAYNGSAWLPYGNTINFTSSLSIAYVKSITMANSGQTIGIGDANVQQTTVYDYQSGTWVLRGTAIQPPNELNSGQSTSLSDDGNTIAISASNRIRVYRWVNPVWIQIGQILTISTNNYVSFVSLSASGTILAVGDAFYNNYDGRVIIYRYDGTGWNQLGSVITVSGGNYFGTSVSMSDDGMTFAATAYGASTAYMRIYDYSGSNWVLRGTPISGAGGSYIRIVNLSGEGRRAVLGSGPNFIPTTVNVFCV